MMVYIDCVCVQASLIAEELMKNSPDAVQVLFNKFRSAIAFKPTIATILTPEVGAAQGILSAQSPSS